MQTEDRVAKDHIEGCIMIYDENNRRRRQLQIGARRDSCKEREFLPVVIHIGECRPSTKVTEMKLAVIQTSNW